MWIARDEDNHLRVYLNKPIRYGFYWQSVDTYNGVNIQCISLPNNLFPNLKWEDEPIEVDIIKL